MSNLIINRKKVYNLKHREVINERSRAKYHALHPQAKTRIGHVRNEPREESVKKAIEMRNRGLILKEIAKELDTTVRTVSRYLKDRDKE